MAQLPINILRTVRLKNVVLGGLVLISLALSFSFVESDNRATGTINKSEALLMITAPLILIGALVFTPFTQILECNENELSLYYRLGPIKFKNRIIGKARAILLEQNELKYYWIRIQLVNGDLVDMEKHSTLDWATIWYEEYKRLIDHGKVAV